MKVFGIFMFGSVFVNMFGLFVGGLLLSLNGVWGFVGW